MMNFKYIFLSIVFFLPTVSIFGGNWRFFSIGNSHTGDSTVSYARYGLYLSRYFTSRGHTFSNEWHIEGSQSLSSIWAGGSFTEKLNNFDYDILILQPAGTPPPGQSRITAKDECDRFIDFVEYKNEKPNRVILYQNLPGLLEYNSDRSDLFADYWNSPYSSPENAFRTNRECYIYMYANLLLSLKDSGISVEIAPTSEVLYEIEKAVLKGKFTGLSTIHDFYRDYLHLNELGRYATSVTLYATITGEDPLGLPLEPLAETKLLELTEGIDNAITSEEFARIVQEIVSKVTSFNRYMPDNLPFEYLMEKVDQHCHISFKTFTGYRYHIEKSNDLINWEVATETLAGNGNVISETIEIEEGKCFFKVLCSF